MSGYSSDATTTTRAIQQVHASIETIVQDVEQARARALTEALPTLRAMLSEADTRLDRICGRCNDAQCLRGPCKEWAELVALSSAARDAIKRLEREDQR